MNPNQVFGPTGTGLLILNSIAIWVVAILLIPAIVMDIVKKRFYWSKRWLIVVGAYLMLIFISTLTGKFLFG